MPPPSSGTDLVRCARAGVRPRPRALARVLRRGRRTACRRRRAFGSAARLGLGRPRLRHRAIDRPRVGTADARVRRSRPMSHAYARRWTPACPTSSAVGRPGTAGTTCPCRRTSTSGRSANGSSDNSATTRAAGLTTLQWLTTPQQLLSEITAGEVFWDGTGELEPLRKALEWYPDDVWRWLVGCQWWRIDQEEPFVGRAAEVGDELGSRVVAARLARDAMRLGFLLERRYAPYTKWLGSAFAQLECATRGRPAARAHARRGRVATRESAWVEAIEALARRHNALGLTAHLEPTVRTFHSRPFRVIDAGRFATACIESVSDSLAARAAARRLDRSAAGLDGRAERRHPRAPVGRLLRADDVDVRL